MTDLEGSPPPTAPSEAAIDAFIRRAEPCSLPHFLRAQWDEAAAQKTRWAGQTQEDYLRQLVRDFLTAAYLVDVPGRPPTDAPKQLAEAWALVLPLLFPEPRDAEIWQAVTEAQQKFPPSYMGTVVRDFLGIEALGVGRPAPAPAAPPDPELIITPAIRDRLMDEEAMRLCALLPKGSPLREAANSTRLEGESIVPFIAMYIEELQQAGRTPPPKVT